MKQNEGKTDRTVRVVIGLAAFFAGYFFSSGVISTILYTAGTVALITGITGFCGLYALLGISTHKKFTEK